MPWARLSVSPRRRPPALHFARLSRSTTNAATCVLSPSSLATKCSLSLQLVFICYWMRTSGPRRRGCPGWKAAFPCPPMRAGLNTFGDEDFHVHSPVKVYPSSLEETTRLLKGWSLERALLLETRASGKTLLSKRDSFSRGGSKPCTVYSWLTVGHSDLWVRKPSQQTNMKSRLKQNFYFTECKTEGLFALFLFFLVKVPLMICLLSITVRTIKYSLYLTNILLNLVCSVSSWIPTKAPE